MDSTYRFLSGNANGHNSIGPVLFLHGCRERRLALTALLVRPADTRVPRLTVEGADIAGDTLLRRDGVSVLAYRFSLPATADASYRLDGMSFAVATDVQDDLRIAYVSCNGQETGDRERTPAERNALWQRLVSEHGSRAFNLLLQGGDQLYADELLQAHPLVRAWADGTEPHDLSDACIEEVRETLRSYLLQRYLELWNQPEPAHFMARVPSLCMWDDHDICDGWGSLPPERLDSPIGRCVFQTAREFFLVFQLGARPDNPPPICGDLTGATLTWAVQLPGAALIAPDLRSERRPDRVLGPAGRRVFSDNLDACTAGRTFVLSSVPALGPRLSWVEAAMRLTPRMEKYEDDLRDQWQSRAHRSEWRAFLRRLLARHEREGYPVTVLSGEIHLATRATMAARRQPLHQLVASGIAHPPPPAAYARALGGLARLGESPVPGHPIRLHPLPGQRYVYTAQRNYLVLERSDGQWSAWWELEQDGPTPALRLDAGWRTADRPAGRTADRCDAGAEGD